jgi:hypothetical protein
MLDGMLLTAEAESGLMAGVNHVTVHCARSLTILNFNLSLTLNPRPRIGQGEHDGT